MGIERAVKKSCRCASFLRPGVKAERLDLTGYPRSDSPRGHQKNCAFARFRNKFEKHRLSLVFLFHDQTQLALRWRVGRDLRGFD